MNSAAFYVLFCAGWVVFAQAESGDPPAAEVVAAQAILLGGGRSGEDCPAGTLYGQDQNPDCSAYYYADYNFCSDTLCERVRYENFPPPGITPPATPIGVVSWRGIYIDANHNGSVDKPDAQFRIRFYPIAAGGGPEPNTTYPYEYHVASRDYTGETALITGGTVPAPIWRFMVVLDTPVNLTAGWFGLTCMTGASPPVYHLWQSSAEGDDIIYEDWESDGWDPAQRPNSGCEGLTYCFAERKMGACCHDCVPLCEENVSEFHCSAFGGRFIWNGTCAMMDPPCGQALGACCYDDGTCLPRTCLTCICQPCYCVGDMNCDGTTDFGDINPFVLYLSNNAVWQSTYPGCPLVDGDINCDGVYGQSSFGDINPFVALMTLCANGCPCPGPLPCASARFQGQYWAGANTTCPDACCTVVVPQGATLENEPHDCAPDTFNGGCNMTTPLFTAIANGQTIYGESGTYGAGKRDTDWYRVTVSGPTHFTVTVRAEFDVVVWAFRLADGGDPCAGYADVAAPVGPPIDGHNQCTDVVLATRCLPAGSYAFVVEPASFGGVDCGADYKITLNYSPGCEMCMLAPCPAGAYLEGTPAGSPEPGYCMYDANEPTNDPENGGCNMTPAVFELLPMAPNDPNAITFCGRLWAGGGYRDLDWYGFDVLMATQIHWSVTSEVPCRATLLFSDPGGGFYGPPVGCDEIYYYWVDTVCDPCVTKVWNSNVYYAPGFYWFLVMPEDNSGSIWYGYPCPMGAADLGNDYQVTLTVYWFPPCDVCDKPHGFTEAEPGCGPGYVDTYNSGCDALDPPGPWLDLGFGTTNAWCSSSGTWREDPNDPSSLKKDYDWYQFFVTANRRFRVCLYANYPATWEIWKSNDCAFGPIEGLDVPACSDTGYWTVRCYTPGTYWLRVYPTPGFVNCGDEYWLALTDAGQCSVCTYSCTGMDLDDPCDDLTDYDTNAGCDDPNGLPPHFMAFNCGATYCGRCYAGLQNGANYYDSDWFQITQTNMTNRRIRLMVTAEFLAHAEVYASCSDYDDWLPIGGLEGFTDLTSGTGCPNMLLTSITGFVPGTTVYGRITIVDQLHNLLTKYYPCAKGFNRWKIVVACII